MEDVHIGITKEHEIFLKGHSELLGISVPKLIERILDNYIESVKKDMDLSEDLSILSRAVNELNRYFEENPGQAIQSI